MSNFIKLLFVFVSALMVSKVYSAENHHEKLSEKLTFNNGHKNKMYDDTIRNDLAVKRMKERAEEFEKKNNLKEKRENSVHEESKTLE